MREELVAQVGEDSFADQPVRYVFADERTSAATAATRKTAMIHEPGQVASRIPSSTASFAR